MTKKNRLLGLAVSLGALFACHQALAAPTACGKLKDLKFESTRVMVAEEITPDPIWVYPPSLFTTMAERSAKGPLGAQKPFCRVVGIIEKEINFEVWLPRDWNGKFQGLMIPTTPNG